MKEVTKMQAWETGRTVEKNTLQAEKAPVWEKDDKQHTIVVLGYPNIPNIGLGCPKF